ncbi:MAG: PA0069 family radical SAM protein [Gammaproteobacteria bacterium]|jgi:DNA repair photolyase
MDTEPDTRIPAQPRKGRGAVSNPDGRFESRQHQREDDGWTVPEPEEERLRTTLDVDTARRVITRNDSPDVPFSQSVNPYRGCEHGCSYCFARPSHAYLGLSAGLDFETRLFYKPDAAARLREELAKPGYVCDPIALGINTDAYQPVERRTRLTRSLLEVLWEFRHPVSIVTKSALIERDLDIIAPMAQAGLIHVMFSITTLDPGLARRLEPRAATPARRLEAMRRLHEAGVPVGVLFAPLIPALNDAEMESVLEAAAEHGARAGGYVLLRLPHEVAPLFQEWLRHHEPLKAEHVMSLVRQMRGGKDYDARFGARMRGMGVMADLYARRCRVACRRLGLDRGLAPLNRADFRVPASARPQLSLFD